MRLTNNLALPQPIVAAIEAQMGSYDRGDCRFSVTDLCTPPQIVILRRQFEDQLVEDVSQRIWMLLGTAIHQILEMAGDQAEGEVRLFGTFEGVKFSGQFDHLALVDNMLTDYKVTSSYSVKGEAKPEWVKQLNYYRWLAIHNGMDVDQLQITAILRDWNQHGMRDPAYPTQSVVNVPIPVWHNSMVEAQLSEDINYLTDAEAGTVRRCTDEERWCVPGKVALMKKGRKSAIKLFDTKIDAITFVDGDTCKARLDDGQHYLEERPTKYRRCEDYCSVSEFCEQYQGEQE